ncbi:MAG: flagellin [Caulobacteraceae bacterium]|nr:flagellin [Caulobacter sp.]
MANSINTNVSAQVALQTLNATNQSLANTQNRISTGLKVNDAKDDSAVWSIAQTMRSQNAALDSVTASLNRGKSTLDVANTAGSAISDLLTQMQSAVLAASDTSLDQASRNSYQQKYASLATQISTYVKNAAFNGVNLLDGSTPTYSALANADGTQKITAAGQNLSLAASYTGGIAGVPSVLTGTAAPGTATTAITQPSTFTISVDGGAAISVGLTATGGSGANGKYSAQDLANAINSTAGLAGVASVNSSGFLQLTSPTTGTATALTVAAGTPAGDFSSAAAVKTALGVSATGGSAQTAAVPYTETGGGGVITISGTETFTASTNYADLISRLKTTIANVSTALGSLGAANNAMTNHLTFVSKLQDSLTTGIGNLVDADVAKESANLTALQTKQQLGVQALSIANSAPQTILALFKG